MEIFKVKKIEHELNSYKLEDKVPLGSLISMAVRLTPKEFSLKFFVRLVWHFLLPLVYPKNVFEIQSSANKNNKISVFVTLAGSNYRFLDFVRGMLNSGNFRFYLTLPDIKEFKNSTRSIFKIWLFSWGKIIKAGMKIFKISGINFKEKVIVFYCIIIQVKQYYFARKILSILKPDIVLADFDRYSANIPFILAARNLSIKTVTLVHGATNPPQIYVPVIADHLFAWGQYHEYFFTKEHSQTVKCHIVGNPKIKLFEENRQFPYAADEISIGWATTNKTPELRKRLTRVFEEGTNHVAERIVKIHPQEKVEWYHEFQSKLNLQIVDNQMDNEVFFKKINILCVRRSQIGSDALSYNIPIIVIDADNSRDLQNGEILYKYVGCPLVNTSEELKEEIDKLLINRKYLKKRLYKQSEYFNILYQYQNEDSTRKMEEAIESIVNKS